MQKADAVAGFRVAALSARRQLSASSQSRRFLKFGKNDLPALHTMGLANGEGAGEARAGRVSRKPQKALRPREWDNIMYWS